MKLKTSLTILGGCLIIFVFIMLPIVLSVQGKKEDNVASYTGSSFTLTDVNNNPITEKSFQSPVTALFFGFTHCPDVCPMTLNKLNNGKYSETSIKIIQSFGICSLIECTLKTGRTHQVRLHLTSINSPLVGDQTYGKSKLNQFGKNKDTFNKFMILKNFGRHALHAMHLGFIHPKQNKKMEFNSKLPEDITNLLDLLVKY